MEERVIGKVDESRERVIDLAVIEIYSYIVRVKEEYKLSPREMVQVMSRATVRFDLKHHEDGIKKRIKKLHGWGESYEQQGL